MLRHNRILRKNGILLMNFYKIHLVSKKDSYISQAQFESILFHFSLLYPFNLFLMCISTQALPSKYKLPTQPQVQVPLLIPISYDR